jgi:hypothetical protein
VDRRPLARVETVDGSAEAVTRGEDDIDVDERAGAMTMSVGVPDQSDRRIARIRRALLNRLARALKIGVRPD